MHSRDLDNVIDKSKQRRTDHEMHVYWWLIGLVVTIAANLAICIILTHIYTFTPNQAFKNIITVKALILSLRQEVALSTLYQSS
jgi:hypothetical protein